jgi:predicted ATP-dependent Lon-type protease
MGDKKEKSFSVKPFTNADREQALVDINDELDARRTVCNVIRLIFQNSQEGAYNLGAVRELALEAMWMGKRMNAKLTKLRQDEMKKEYIPQKDSHLNENYDSYPAQGNWD